MDTRSNSSPVSPQPSKETSAYWITASRKKGDYPSLTEYSGKWMLFIPPERIDEIWAKIREATEEGLLGDSSKVATARLNPLAKGSRSKIICIYTYDHRDREDVTRIRGVLRQLEFTNKISYKADQDTREGRYGGSGQRVALYYE